MFLSVINGVQLMEVRLPNRGQSRQLKPVLRPNNRSVVIGFYDSLQGFKVAIHGSKVAKIINANTNNFMDVVTTQLQLNHDEICHITLVFFANLNDVHAESKIRNYLSIAADQKHKNEINLVCLKEQDSGVTLENSEMNWIHNKFDHVEIKEYSENADIYNEVVKGHLEKTYHDVRKTKQLDEVEGFVILDPDKYIPKKIVIPESLDIAPGLQNEFRTRINNFLTYRDKLWAKQEDLRARGYYTAADKAEALHKNISVHAQTYLNELADPDNKSLPEKKYEDFKNHTLAAIKAARGELETHRGWKRFLVNFAALIASLIIFFPLVLKIHHHYKKHYLFFDRTSSHKKLDKLENTIHRLDPRTLQQ